MDPNVLYSGVWAPEERQNRILVQATLDVLKTTWQSNRDEGFHLETLDVSGLGAEREWVGVFVKNEDEGTVLESDLSLDEIKSMHPDLRLKTFVAYSDGSDDLYAGAWVRSDSQRQFDGNLSLSEFAAKIKELRDDKFHLVDFQTCVSSGERKWAGLWQKMDADFRSEIWIDFDQDHFRVKRKENAEKDMQLVRMKTYRSDGRTRYSGVWHPGKVSRLVFVDMGFDSLRQQVQQLRQQGFGLVDLDARSLEDGGDAVEVHFRLAVTQSSLDNWLQNARNRFAELARLNIRKMTDQLVNPAFRVLNLNQAGALAGLIATASGLPSNAIVVFLVDQILNQLGPVNGVTSHSPKGIVISNRNATPWTLAHELGHLLMGHDMQAQQMIHDRGGHRVQDSSNLMFTPTSMISAILPELMAEQINIIKKSPLIVRR